jgi:hypothetical protein
MGASIQRRASRNLAIGWVTVCLALSIGCTRERYFRKADEDVQCLITEKSDDPRWAAPDDFTVMMDPRSRYYDPCNQIRPPMPEDDPASHEFMHCVDGMKGWRYWHKNGDRSTLENPDWRERLPEYVPVTDDGKVKLSVDSAMELARIHSPDYQSQLETLYLSALDVSTERFRFETQFFGVDTLTMTNQGRLLAGGAPRPGGSRSTLQNDNDLEAHRQLPTGDFRVSRGLATAGELLVGFANSMVWQFAGPDTYATSSLLNFNFVQPLLRGGGRDVALEQLTITERTLLANLRAFQRYRQGFYTQVAIGESNVSGPQRRGGFFGGTGLTGFFATGGGGFGGIGEVTGFGRGGFGFAGGGGTGGGGAGFAGGGASSVGGFVGLLQRFQQVQNKEETLAVQLRTLGLLEAQLQAGTIDLVQVDEFRQNTETTRATLLQEQNDLESSLDTYRTATLGLPPDLPLVLDVEMIRPFQFIDPLTSRLQNRLADFRSEFGDQPPDPPVAILRQALDRLDKIHSDIVTEFTRVAKDLQNASQCAPARERGMTPAERKQFSSDLAKLRDDYAALGVRLEKTAKGASDLRSRLTEGTRRTIAYGLIQLLSEVTSILDELSLVQARARVEQITVEYQPLDPNDALDIARANRLDWMNNRATLVDTWRLIQFNANALEAVLDVTLSGDMSTTGNNPMRFRAPTGNLRAGLRLDGPFTRLLERNNFRQVIIDYQRDRRQLIQYEDSVQQTLRERLRRLAENRLNLEIQRRAVMIAIRRVDQTRETLNTPPPAPKPGEPVTSLGETAAFKLLTALNDLLSAQNNFMSVWLKYYAIRMGLARDLGTMQLDERGMWLDVPLEDAERLRAEDAPLPPEVPDSLIKALDKDLPARQPAPATAPAPLPPERDPAIRPKETPEPATKSRPAPRGTDDPKSSGGGWQKKDTRSRVTP